ncbi:MAG: hypothetical protein EBY21_08175 [Alphaproteobacteria bacterium]|nr:hypothetical protein [Alphaproteobacteria bacterium]
MSDVRSSDLRLSDDRWSERLTRSQKHIALIRDLTDFYVQKPFHSQSEQHQYQELMLPMLADTDAQLRLWLTQQLVPHPAAPWLVLAALALVDDTCAEMILSQRETMPANIQLELARMGTSKLVYCLAQRADLTPDTRGHLLQRPEGEQIAHFLKAPRKPVKAASSAPAQAAAPTSAQALQGESPLSHMPLFLEATISQRSDILLAAEREALRLANSPDARGLDIKACIELISLAKARNLELFTQRLSQALACEIEQSQALIRDGQALAMALLALGMPTNSCLEVFTYLQDVSGEVTVRMRGLEHILEHVSRRAARMIVRAILGSDWHASGAKANARVQENSKSASLARGQERELPQAEISKAASEPKLRQTG